MSSRSRQVVRARAPLVVPTIGRHQRKLLRRNPGKVPFTAMWTPPRVRALLNKAYAAQTKKEHEGTPDRAFRRAFVRQQLPRLRLQTPQLNFKTLWRWTLTATES